MSEIKVKKQVVEVRKVDDEKVSKVIFSDNAVDIKTFEREIKQPLFTKRKGNVWVNNDTGEIVKGKKNTSGIRSRGSLSKTFSKMRTIIRHNFVGDKSETFLTLTFDRKIDDTKDLEVEFDNFWDRYSRWNKGIDFRVLVVVEPLDVRDFHFHCLIKRLDGKRLYSEQKKLLELWGNGSVWIERLYDSKWLGVYLSSLYIKKKQDKLKFYPIGLQVYRKRGKFENMNKFDMKHGEVVKMSEDMDYRLDEIKSFELIDEESNKVINQFTEEYWLKRKGK